MPGRAPSQGIATGPQNGNSIATAPPERKESDSRFTAGFAIAPTWNAFFSDGRIIRGFASQLRFGMETYTVPMIWGLELRPEWDGTLGVFRLPITLSVGRNDKYRFFGGPVLSVGDPTLQTIDGPRTYSNGTTWFGAAGVTIAPVSIKVATGNLAPYAELAWQSYFPYNNSLNLGADFAAGLRFSTGLRYTWKFTDK